MSVHCTTTIEQYCRKVFLDPKNRHKLTADVGDRWYQAPELLVHRTDYSRKVDIWAAGCVFVEMMMVTLLYT